MSETASSKVILTAAWVAPMSGPLIRDGAVFFRDGIIAGVGPRSSLKDEMTDAVVVDAGNAVILPGLVNAHTHLELSSIQRGQPPARFVDWIIELMKTPAPPGGVEAGIAQCIRFGVTAIGDITSQPAVTRPILANSPLRGVSYGEVRAMAQRRGFLEPRLAAAIQPMGSIQPGITPHAPYSIESNGYQRCLQTAKERSLPLATHLAETPDEATFLADQSGPFKELWDLLKSWDEQVPKFAGGPIRFAKRLGLLDYPTLLAHVNYCDDGEMNLLAHGQAGVVYCPRTHAFFGHPPHRWRDMLARGINVAVGTDSCASSPDLNLVDDLRLMHRLAPEVDAGVLWEMATCRAAKAINATGIGSLQSGHLADAVVFPAAGENPLAQILESNALPFSTWIGSRRHGDALSSP
jgi:cytosine/adenosine deaminase-related metal-dependent hydrolase